ncbi:MAG: cytidylate kinase [Ignavibacteria bacterium GWF2_33_9]|nr:MAG: cytidylate kinase [Ignavibacteria bacterium GWF2_33_9]
MARKEIIIAIDGPAGSGKSTTARFVANKLNYIYIDTGAMYRTVALAWLRSGLNFLEKEIETLLPNLHIEMQQGEAGQIVLLNGEDVSAEIRKPEVTKYSSSISAFGSVREKLVAQQREMGVNGGVVMDGRDIGTVVFPDAELKIFLIASVKTRAERRQKELMAKGHDESLESIINAMQERDKNDSSREISPLRKAEDAIELDTSDMTIEQQCDFVISKASEILKYI